MTSLRDNVQAVLGRISAAAKRAQHDPGSITLIAVSKQKPIEDILAAYDAGVRHFGENRVEELESKALAIADRSDLRWHFIGQLQTRQSLPVAQYADYFHAVDRVKIAERLSSQLKEIDRSLAVFVQVNVSGEETKGGFACANWQQDNGQFDALGQAVRAVAALPRLDVKGLMTMAPFDAPELELRRIFTNMSALSEQLINALPEFGLRELSMGMSGDYEIAVEAGATHVRIGSAIFGSRAK